MSIKKMINRWSETIAVTQPTSNNTNQYGELTFEDSEDIDGRLIETEEEVINDKGDKVIAKAKLFTSESDLKINTKIGNYKIFSSKELKNHHNEIECYKYWLK